jgi:transcriptional regulator with XRE-family HTH domain
MPHSTTDLGAEVRYRRTALGLSVRALAQAAGVSAGYVTAIENGRSASTGRAPEVSLRVLDGIAAALGCTVDELTGSRAHADAPHVLLYCVDATGPLFATVDHTFGADVDHWIYIADPRHAETAPKGRATICTWELGAFPYANTHLEPQDILAALEREVAKVAATLKGQRVGLAIMDCSAVMRYVQNAADEVNFEREWHSGVHRIWHDHLQREPAIDVCGYRHADVEALGLTIDQLGTALTLISTHDRVVVAESDDVTVSGRAAIRRILAEARPAGVSAAAWREITRAAADSLALA